MSPFALTCLPSMSAPIRALDNLVQVASHLSTRIPTSLGSATAVSHFSFTVVSVLSLHKEVIRKLYHVSDHK